MQLRFVKVEALLHNAFKWMLLLLLNLQRIKVPSLYHQSFIQTMWWLLSKPFLTSEYLEEKNLFWLKVYSPDCFTRKIRLKASFNNVFTLTNLSYMYMSLHAVSVVDKVALKNCTSKAPLSASKKRTCIHTCTCASDLKYHTKRYS